MTLISIGTYENDDWQVLVIWRTDRMWQHIDIIDSSNWKPKKEKKGKKKEMDG